MNDNMPNADAVSDVINDVFRTFAKAEITYGVGLAILGTCVTNLIQTADTRQQRVQLAINFTRGLMETLGVEARFEMPETGIGDEPLPTRH